MSDLKRSIILVMVLAMFALLVFPVGVVFAQAGTPSYQITFIGQMIPGATGGAAMALNEDGDVAGYVAFDSSWEHVPFLYTAELGPILLPRPTWAVTARALDLSDRLPDGTIDIVGWAANSIYSGDLAVAWRVSHSDGSVLEMVELGTLEGQVQSQAKAVNSSGDRVGYSGGFMQFGGWATLFAPAGPEPISNLQTAVAVNEARVVLAGRGFSWESARYDLNSGSEFALGRPEGRFNGAIGVDMNDLGQVAAEVLTTDSDPRGQFISQVWRFSDGFGWQYLFGGGSSIDVPYAVNNRGDVTGRITAGLNHFDILYVEGLGAFIIEDLLAGGYVAIDGLNDINDRQQIASSGPGGPVLLNPGCDNDAACDNGLFCDGVETCNTGSGLCEAGTAPDCDDGAFCNGAESCNESTDNCDAGTVPCDPGSETCNEGTDACEPIGCTTDSDCDDGAFCNGAESCNAVGDRQAGVPPACGDGTFCNGTEICNESTASCEAGTAPCDPGTETCNEDTDVCEPIGCTTDADCDDGVFCNGAETCDAAGDCQAGTPVSCNDGVGCTVDSCNEATDSCDATADDGACDDGLFCNGTETCDAVSDCQAGTDPCGAATCNEADDVCEGGVDTSVWMSFRSSTVVAGVGTVRDEDIVSYNEATGTWSLEFDGSDVGLGAHEIDGLALLPAGDLLLSFRAAGSVDGVSFDDSDVLRFTPTAMGPTTAGSFSLYFDGSDVSLSSNSEDIDSIALAADGRLIVSTQGTFRGSGASGADEDLFIFTGSLGPATSGSFALHFDGSDVGLSSKSEDVDAAALTSAGTLLFSTTGDFSVSGASGANEDVGEFAGTFGSSTSGTFSRRLDLSALGIDPDEDVGSLAVVE